MITQAQLTLCFNFYLLLTRSNSYTQGSDSIKEEQNVFVISDESDVPILCSTSIATSASSSAYWKVRVRENAIFIYFFK